MFEPTRGGTRGGQAEFKWSDVSADKDREHYLGHSINAPTGRWQKNKDVHWYNRDRKDTDVERAAEIKKVKEAEAEALSAALGFAPTPKALGNAPVSGANATGVTVKIAQVEALEKEEKRRKKAERKEEKRARREARRAEHAMTERSESEELRRRRRRDRSRSRSPRDYRIRDKGPHPSRRHSRSRSPRTHSRHYAPSGDSHYGVAEREEVESRDRRYSRK